VDAVGRVPIARNAFLGRESALREVVRRLSAPDTRLVTIAGRGGVGKTRLALEVARRIGGGYPGGVVFIDLALAEYGDVVELVASALEIRVAPGQPPRRCSGFRSFTLHRAAKSESRRAFRDQTG
jgi:predicted ATPase